MGCYTTCPLSIDNASRQQALERVLGTLMYDAIWIFGLALLVLIAAWNVNRSAAFRRHRGRRLVVWAVGVALIGGVSTLLLDAPRTDRGHRPSIGSDGTATARPDGGERIDWAAFDSALWASALRRNQPVFMKYTADWCARCMANERLYIEVEPTRQILRATRVLAMAADMTTENEEIATWLAKLGRVAPPTYVIYLPDGSHDLLPDAISSELLVERIALAAKRFPASSFGLLPTRRTPSLPKRATGSAAGR